ncbi:MAG: DNA-directed RNA polymerase sigma-70 factor [Alphaproteobacteria bacterium]|nr:MAG: DNA-directed RNA polymerase sigma-70 factor [Alphaproteobacteria bacterium]
MTDFEERVVAHLPGLRRFARSLCRDALEAEDLVQDCVARAFAARRSFRGDNLKAWLATIMVNHFRGNLRRARSRPVMLPIDDWQARLADGGQGDPVAQNRLSTAIDQLGPDQRVVLMLVVVEGYRYEEVAQILSVPVGTVMSRLSRARRLLAEILRGDNIVEFRSRR